MFNLTISISLAFLLAGPASANVIAVHTGAADPTSEGFVFSNTGTPVLSDLGFDAWQYAGCGCPTDYHSGPLTAQQKADAFAYGWELDLRARLPQNDNVLFGNVDFGNVRYDINLILSPGGSLTVNLNNFGTGPSYTYLVPGSGSAYHLYTMLYDPGSASASFQVDGTTVLTGYTGHNLSLNDLGLWFGTVGGSNGPGNFNLVSLQVDTPEPASVFTLGIGIFCMIIVRRAR